MYDYHSDLNIVFTGSSILDIKKGSADLSRRAVMYHMQGLSFREYLNLFYQIEVPQFTLDEILTNRVDVSQIKNTLPLFDDYYKCSYTLFYFERLLVLCIE